MTKLSKTSLENAEVIIERFGGIRPTATKTGVAVTTVQGWKKRNVIPENRYDVIVTAAARHGVDLTDILGGKTPANTKSSQPVKAAKQDKPSPKAAKEAASKSTALVGEDYDVFEDAFVSAYEDSKKLKTTTPEPDLAQPEQDSPKSKKSSKPAAKKSHSEDEYAHYVSDYDQSGDKDDKNDDDYMEASVIVSMLHDDIVQKIKQAEGRAVNKSLLINISLIALTVIGLGLVFLPTFQSLNQEADDTRTVELEKQNRQQQGRIDQLNREINQMKDDMQSIKDRQGFFGQIIPDDLSARLDAIKQQAQTARDSALGAVEEARTLSGEIASGQTESLRARLEALEKQLNEIGNPPLMASLVQRYDAFTATSGGQNLLENTTNRLAEILKTVNPQDKEQLELTIDQARRENADLSQSFEGVPADDLKAAAMLLTMTQLRSALNREKEPFANDLEVLRSLVGESNPALTASIDRLAPHAEQGVLTPSGLSDELKSITGDVVVASLKGEDVSFTDRVKARLNNIFQLEKDGELLTGTPAQATIAKAEAHMQAGNIEAAIAELKTLEGGSAEVVAPWMAQAEATIMVERLKETLSSALQTKTFGSAARYTTGGGTGLPSEFIYDESSGTAILKRRNSLPKIAPATSP